MKRIMGTRVEVEKVEAEVYASLEVIKRDQRERVRVSETIMNLLLKLDSVRVLNYYSGVRECRKSVIKKAIALQEMVDQMVGSNDQGEETHHGDEGKDEKFGFVGESQGEEMEERVESSLVEEENSLVKEEEEGGYEGASEMLVADSQGEKMEEWVGTSLDEEENNCLVKEEEEEEGSCEGASEMLVVDSHCEKMEGLRNEENEEEEEAKMEVEEEEEGEGECVGQESVGTSLVEENNCLVKEEEEHGDGGRVEDGGESGGREGNHRELLEKMMEDNEKMMKMMAQLFEKNEMQTSLLTSLSQRVEQLERAFACDKLRKIKRRNCDAKHKQNQPKNGSI